VNVTRIFALVVAPLAALSVRADPPVPRPDERKPVTIPFELLDTGHMAIRVKLNDKGPFRVIFDTGAPSVLFSGKAARESGMIPADAKSGFMGNYSAKVKPVAVAVGDFRVKGVVPSVSDHPTVEALASAVGPLEGLVGFDLFAPDKLTIDYRAKTITVVPAKEQKAHDKGDDEKKLNDRLFGPAKVEYSAPAALWGLAVNKAAGDDKPGVAVVGVSEGSAAAEAGLKAGDRLLVLSRRWTDSVEDVYRAAAFVWAGKAVTVTVRRGDKDVELTVKPRAGF